MHYTTKAFWLNGSHRTSYGVFVKEVEDKVHSWLTDEGVKAERIVIELEK